ncbi:MAG TPA: DUF445 domain-containing protein [Acidimicrobiales bacterium]|nr:DUF445 domain-containing protein [Acidimicrobiales bacterium]
MKRRATGLLLLMAMAFVVVTVLGHGRGWTGYVQAAIEASLVGGLADWFAVTALFRHPLGLPIPHTAVITERKDQFGRTLGEFVQQNFLNPDVMADRVRSAHLGSRLADWLATDKNAVVIARQIGDLAVGLPDLVGDEDIRGAVEDGLRRAVAAVPAAPLAGRMLRLLTADGRDQELLGAAIERLSSFLDNNRDALREQFRHETPWWLPSPIDSRIFDRLLDGVRSLLQDVRSDPQHQLRREFDEWLSSLEDRLERSPELRQRGEELKHDLLDHAELRQWSSSMWAETKVRLRAQVGEPQSAFQQRLTELVVTTGRRLRDNPAWLAKVDDLFESVVRYVAEHFHDEIAGLVSGTIERWDASETSRKLELLLGRDLQFIRINGTIVGGLAGLAIHAIARAIG